mmetsp:Transcript_52243/g.125096  ORF Transcript_52243/g.125096 Transcript_52243/m.125096 type:complete len:268 (-) Transcript_52243:1428-2231(-)
MRPLLCGRGGCNLYGDVQCRVRCSSNVSDAGDVHCIPVHGSLHFHARHEPGLVRDGPPSACHFHSEARRGRRLRRQPDGPHAHGPFRLRLIEEERRPTEAELHICYCPVGKDILVDALHGVCPGVRVASVPVSCLCNQACASHVLQATPKLILEETCGQQEVPIVKACGRHRQGIPPGDLQRQPAAFKNAAEAQGLAKVQPGEEALCNDIRERLHSTCEVHGFTRIPRGVVAQTVPVVHARQGLQHGHRHRIAQPGRLHRRKAHAAL